MTKRRFRKLKKEKNGVYNRIKKLNVFMNGSGFKQLSIIEQDMLRAQHDAMFVYGIILHDRIAYYEGKPTCNHWEGMP